MMGGIEAALAEHAFEHLFIECLGWDRVRAQISLALPDSTIDVAGIAQKRGFTVFLASMDDFAAYDAAYREVVPDPKPARATVGASIAPLKVEIQATAVLPQGD